MPIYEFYCEECNTIFSFFSRRINTTARPECLICRRLLERQMSVFSTVGRAKEDDDIMAGIDESKMERALGELAMEAEGISEDDPQQMAQFMRKFSEKSGLNLGDGMEEALSRLEAGEDPETIEEQMGDLFKDENPFTPESKKARRLGDRKSPFRDETLYEL
jgi:putative FmdB family regulatory protein